MKRHARDIHDREEISSITDLIWHGDGFTEDPKRKRSCLETKNPALADDYPVRTARDVAIEREMEERRRGRPVKTASKERPDYEENRKDDECGRLSKSGAIY